MGCLNNNHYATKQMYPTRSHSVIRHMPVYFRNPDDPGVT